MLEAQTSISCETSSIFETSYLKIDFLVNLKICDLKIDVSWDSVNFHYISQNVTPATEFARCHHFTRPWQCDSQKTRNATHLKCCACHAKWRWRSPKCCACNDKCNSSAWNDARVLRVPHKTIFNTLWNMLDCHEVPRLPRETRLRDFWNLQNWPLLQNPPEARPYGPQASGCTRLRKVWRTQPTQAPDPQSETGTLATHSGTGC